MKERLQKILSARGVASRRACERLIESGRVAVNGLPCKLGDTAEPETDVITLDGKVIPAKPQSVYIMLNKPRGCVTTMNDDRGRKTVAELLRDCPERVYPVGRLDYDSEGLLILTNDGALTQALTHPSHEVEKVYVVRTLGEVSDDALSRLRAPLTLEDGYTVQAVKIGRGIGGGIEVTIRQGRNRQVRQMCALCGIEVSRLTRVREGTLRLGDLPSGQWRYLTPSEIAHLQNT
jgi:23S rRNA pseudouridine2605 synthase